MAAARRGGGLIRWILGAVMAFGAAGAAAWLLRGMVGGDTRAMAEVAAATLALITGAAGLTLIGSRHWRGGLALILIAAVAALCAAGLWATRPKLATPPAAPRSALLLPWVRPWPGGIVPICWVNRPDRLTAGADDLRMVLAVKQAEETWSGAGAVSFHDVGTCPTEFHGVKLEIIRGISKPEAPTLGAAIADQAQTVGVPFAFESRTDCAAGRRFGPTVCAYGEAMHELGHVLGLPDVHYSNQAPPDCKARLAGDHPVEAIPYDPASVMNSCNDDHYLGQPSPADIQAIRQTYGG